MIVIDVISWDHNYSLCREKRRLRKEKRKLKERLVKKADIHKEVGEIVNQEDLFRLKDIQSKSQLEEVEKGEMAEGKEDEESESDGESLMSGSTFLLVQIKLLTYDMTWVVVDGLGTRLCMQDALHNKCIYGS